MNYYPQYPSYGMPYGQGQYMQSYNTNATNPYIPYMQAQQAQQQQAPMQPTQQPLINGKVVEGEEIVRTTEIPIGSFGVFPKADMSCIFFKTWNNDGTTRIVSYVPIVEESKPEKDVYAELSAIQQSISDLSKKVDNIKPTLTVKRRRESEDDE